MSETIIKPRRIGRKWDLTGCRFGRLVVLQEAGRDARRRGLSLCHCDCGRLTTVRSDHLLSLATNSCGCLHRRHGMFGTPLYNVWAAMKYRCGNPRCSSYPSYGGRGITVCDRWRNSFEAFLADMGSTYGPGLSLDRIDNDSGYSPENCRWVTMHQQAGNKRNNHNLSLEGETHTIAEWSRITGISDLTIDKRLRLGWSVERALTTPVSHR